MNQQNRDIEHHEDVVLLITEFYKKVRDDKQLAKHFTKVDWEHHTPIIVNFWAMILLGETNYRGNPFSKHLTMSLKKEDFMQWLEIFTSTVDELFSGPIADEAKQRARSIAAVFQFRMGIE